jgi:hypothetical protein
MTSSKEEIFFLRLFLKNKRKIRLWRIERGSLPEGGVSEKTFLVSRNFLLYVLTGTILEK